MMNCDDVHHGIYVYLDDEFAPTDAEDFRRHLEACPQCRVLAQREAGFLTHLRQSLETPSAPEGLRMRVEAALDEVSAVEREPFTGDRVWAAGWLRWFAVPAALAALLVLAYVPFVGMGAKEHNDRAVSHVVAAHQRPLPIEVQGTKEEVHRFLQKNVKFAVNMPFEDKKDVRLVGARLTQVDGQAAVIFQYDRNGRRLSVLQAPSVRKEPERFRHRVLNRVNGYGVVTYGRPGVRNAVIGDLSDKELLRLIPASYKTH